MPHKDMSIYITTQYPEYGIFCIMIYLYISFIYVSWLAVYVWHGSRSVRFTGFWNFNKKWKSLPIQLFRFSLIPNIQDRTPSPPIPIPCHRSTSRITHKALQSNFLPHPYTPPVKFFYIRRTSQVFPISRSSQLSGQCSTGNNFHTQFSLQTEISNRNTLIFNKNEHAW